MSAPIRWGILATGTIAAKFATDLKLVPDAEIVAVASRSAGPGDRFAAEHGIPRAHSSWAALAEDPDVDIVYVATPHIAHHAAAKMMLAAGKPVLCEKAFTITGEQARDLVDTARASGVFLAEAMWMRTNPAVQRAAALVAAGEVGEVRALHAEFGVKAPDDPAHRLRDPEQGGGALLDLGVYPVTLAQMLLGTPERVQATARLTPEGVDETTGILLSYASGAHAAISCSIATYGPVAATITGDRGFIELPYPFYRTKQLVINRDPAGTDRAARDSRQPVIEEHGYDGNGLRFQAIEVNRCLREGLRESPMFPHADTIAVMDTMDQVRAAVGVVYPGE